MINYDSIDNITLLDNNLDHILFEFKKENTSFFRIARESHQSLYRAMVEALKGSANLAITGRPSKTRSVKYKIGESPFMEIHKIEINNCEKAWRYSEPEQCEEPKIKENSVLGIHDEHFLKREDYLKGFYDLLAMIQSECYMRQYVMSKTILVSDHKMQMLERLHEDIRNKYEHFIPTSHYSSILGLASVSKICIDLAFEIVFKSKNIMLNIPHDMKSKMEEIELRLHDIIKREENLMLNNLLYNLPTLAFSLDYLYYY